MQENDQGHIKDEPMVSLDKSCDRLQQALLNRNEAHGATSKAKAVAKAQPKAKATAKAKASAKGAPTAKAAAKGKPTPKAATGKPAAKAATKCKGSKATAKACQKDTKKVTKNKLKMTRECVYSRAYHGAFRILACVV